MVVYHPVLLLYLEPMHVRNCKQQLSLDGSTGDQLTLSADGVYTVHGV